MYFNPFLCKFVFACNITAVVLGKYFYWNDIVDGPHPQRIS